VLARIAVALAALVAARPDESDLVRLLDAPGRNCLDELRWQGLRPPELIARLALQPDATVADVGAGPGFLSLPLAAAVPAGRVIATDVRADYLAVARARARRARVRNLETRASPPDAPGLAPASVDLALLAQVDHYLADRASYFAALVPSLKPGGRVALVNYRRYREPDLAAARAAHLRVIDEWSPTPPFFLLVLAPE
jgi:SAM-dependent methyltransferase